MPIQAGDKVPSVELATMTADGIKKLSTNELFAGKRVVIFAVPGAFTPTCNDTHLPGFQVHVDEIKAKGVDTVACVSVNDVFVMGAWGKATNASEHILMLADPNGDLAEAMDLVLDLGHVGLGKRSKRWAAIVQDGVVELINVEPAGDVAGSSAETILAAL